MRGAGCGAGREETGEAAEGLQDAVARGHLRLQPRPVLAPRLRLPRFESLATFYSPAPFSHLGLPTPLGPLPAAWRTARRYGCGWRRVARGAAVLRRSWARKKRRGVDMAGQSRASPGKVHGNAEPFAFGGLLIL